MNFLQNPAWLREFAFDYDRFEAIPTAVFDSINERLDAVQSKEPLVSILIAAYNEEVNILRCVATLARLETTIPFEIIVINNNSKDHTQDTLDRLHVKALFEPRQGYGPPHQRGMQNAAGKYVLQGDADCLYPPCWLNEMMAVLQQPGVSCVYGRYAFIGDAAFPRWKLVLLEQMKNVAAEFRHLHRPYLNAYGISMGYVKEYGLKVGIIMTNFRGHDGRLCLDLMAYGKVKQVRSNKARPWTGTRTLQQNGSFSRAVTARIALELTRFAAYFRPHEPQDLDDPKFSKK